MTPDQRLAVERDRILRSRLWLIPSALWWIVLGAGTLQGLAGRPDDAPHLHLSETLRGWVWIATGLAAFIILVADREKREDPTRYAASLLVVMPTVRALSYSWAWWVYALGNDGGNIAPWYSEGSPVAWYTCVVWWALTWAILSQAVNWRRVCRGARECVRSKLVGGERR